MLQTEKVRFSFGCGFCGAGGRMFKEVTRARQAGSKHICRCRRITIYLHTYYVGYGKPTERVFESN